jgi:hypothetical protein
LEIGIRNWEIRGNKGYREKVYWKLIEIDGNWEIRKKVGEMGNF